MSELTIVTAFFDIGRKDFKGKARSNQKYAEFFKFWSRIKNKIVVYTDSVMAKEVKKIRKEFGLLDKTEVVIIDDVSVIEPNLLKRMEKISKNETFLNYRYMDNSADNNAKYDYVMLLKAWCIKDAVEKELATGMIAWLDFGYNHGGKTYPNKEEFDFLWKVDLPKDKVTMFTKKEDDDKPIFQIIQSYEVYVMGAPFIVPSNLASKLKKKKKRAMISLLDVGFMDDDQTIMLMVSRNTDFVNLVKSNGWNLALKENGASHLTHIEDKSQITLKDKLLYKYRVNKRNKKSINRLKKIFNKDYLD